MGSKAKQATKTAPEKAARKRYAVPPGPGRGHKNPVGLNGSMLEDMRRAYNDPMTPQTPASVKQFRELFLKDAGKFMTLYVRLLGDEKPKDDAMPVGEAEEQCKRMIGELLDEIGVKSVEPPKDPPPV